MFIALQTIAKEHGYDKDILRKLARAIKILVTIAVPSPEDHVCRKLTPCVDHPPINKRSVVTPEDAKRLRRTIELVSVLEKL